MYIYILSYLSFCYTSHAVEAGKSRNPPKAAQNFFPENSEKFQRNDQQKNSEVEKTDALEKVCFSSGRKQYAIYFAGINVNKNQGIQLEY